MLAATFSLTVVLFVSSTVVAQLQSRRFQRDAHAVTDSALTALELLADTRTELRRLDTVVRPATVRGGSGLDPIAVQRVDEHRRFIRQKEEAYRALAVFPGEQPTIDLLHAGIVELDDSLDRALAATRRDDRIGAADEIATRTLPAIALADEDARRAAVINRKRAREAVDRIGTLSQEWSLGLNLVSSTLVLLTAVLVIRVTRRYWTLLKSHATELERFAARVAHDIRSPLGTVGFALDLAKRDPAIAPKTQEILDRGIRTLRRLGQLVDGLLVFAMTDGTSSEVRRAKVKEVLDGVIEDIRVVADEKDIAVDYVVPAPDLEVGCSPGALVSITSNLLGNAVKYMGDSPRREVIVRVRADSKWVRIEVADTGPGIPLALRRDIFLPHARASDTSVPGFGLGLATVRRLAEGNDGSVAVEARIGGGSVFTVQLPRCETRAAARPPRSSARGGGWRRWVAGMRAASPHSAHRDALEGGPS